MTTSFDDIWNEFDKEKAIEEGRPQPPVEFFGTINIPGHILDGCPAQLVEFVSSEVRGQPRHEAVLRLLEDRGIFKAGHEVTIDADAGEWKEA